MIGHDPRYPVTDSWPHLVEETLHTPCKQALHPAGDWRGAFAGRGDHLLAGARRLQAFLRRGVAGCAAVQLARALDLAGQIVGANRSASPGRRRRRRAHWPDADMRCSILPARRCLPSFRRRRCAIILNTAPTPASIGVRLRFQPQIEGRIFATLPHSFAAYRGRAGGARRLRGVQPPRGDAPQRCALPAGVLA